MGESLRYSPSLKKVRMVVKKLGTVGLPETHNIFFRPHLSFFQYCNTALSGLCEATVSVL